MSDKPEAAPASPTGGEAPAYPRPGELLRNAREAQRLSQAEVTQQLRLHPSYVPAMERDDFGVLPGTTFVRGYLRAYARLLGLDEQVVIQAYDHHYGVQEREYQVSSIQTVKPQAKLSDPAMRLATLAVIAVLVVLSIIWWQTRSGDKPGMPLAATDTVTVETAQGETIVESTEPEPELLAEATPAAPEELADSAAPASDGLVDEAAPSDSEPEAETVLTDSPLVAPEAALASAESDQAQPEPIDEPAAAAANSFQMSFSADCWVEVVDGNGQRLIADLKRAGEQLTITGTPPFRLKIGNASGAQVTYLGEVVDLTPYTNRNNIARVTIAQ